jgi:hypothetical protein
MGIAVFQLYFARAGWPKVSHCPPPVSIVTDEGNQYNTNTNPDTKLSE